MSRTLKLFLLGCASAIATATCAAQLSALKAAGLSGIAPRGGNAFVGLVRTLQQNWTWLVSTGLGLVLVLIAGLMVAGSRQAPDWLFRVIGGIMLILVVIPAVLA
jgi:integral membrane sensor domain MASE1